MNVPKSPTTFDSKLVTGNTPHELWVAIQHGAVVCTTIDKNIASLRPADSDETCYVFWDECEQMSMPYASESDVREAFKIYCINLMGDACAEAEVMNDNMRKYGTIDKPASARNK